MKTEPAVIVALVTAVIALAVSFGLNVSQEQQAAVIAVVVIVAGLVTRSKVTPS
jgi:hypothetical protein